MPSDPEDSSPRSRHLPWLLLLFVGSGCAALIYEIVWFQLLQRVIGSSAVSLAVLLGTFMGGMCLGSLLLPQLVGRGRHPLRVYAWIEVGIALCGLLVLVAVPLADRIYVAFVGYGLPSILLRALVCVVCLLPPTMLMGATLPAIARWVEATPRGVAWLGFFYGGNIIGAVAGCLLAGFYLLRVHDMATATWVAVALNLGVAGLAFALARKTPHEAPAGAIAEARDEGGLPVRPRTSPSWFYVVIGISGFCALGAEVVWARLLSLLLGGTVYTFSIILAVFLIGLGLGSSAGAMVARGVASPARALGIAQLLAAAGLTWTSVMIAHSLPYWPVDPGLVTNPWHLFPLDLMRCAWAVLPATVPWGASFPLALAAAARRQDPGKLVGRVYAANTVGAIIGAVAVSMILIPVLGTQLSQRLLVVAAVGGSLIAFIGAAGSTGALRWQHAVPVVVAIGLFAGGAVALVPQIPAEVVTYGRRALTKQYATELVYMGEGMNASVAVTKSGDWRYFHVSGKVEASTDPADMRLQRMLGHMPALLHARPRSVLIVGCGAGVTAGAFVVHPDIERIVICEIEPLIPKVVAEYFGPENHHVLKDPRVEIVYDDARHFIQTTKETFDVITSDPIHPWVKGAAVLYTQEYFDLCRQRLNPGGVISQWVPLYESTPAVVKSEVATFFEVFPHGSIWSNDIDGEGYDTIMIGHVDPLSIDLRALQNRLEQADHARVRESLAPVGFHSALDLLGTYAGRKADLAPWLVGAEINRERSLRLMYLAGMGAGLQHAPAIYEEMIRHRRFPEELFAASPESERRHLADRLLRSSTSPW